LKLESIKAPSYRTLEKVKEMIYPHYKDEKVQVLYRIQSAFSLLLKTALGVNGLSQIANPDKEKIALKLASEILAAIATAKEMNKA